jgi:hypothetical protein
MNSKVPLALMYQAIAIQDEIDKVASKLNSDGAKVFGFTSQGIPKVTPPELGFLRVVSWFYILFFDIGKISIDFLSKRFATYELDPKGELIKHLQGIRCLRTFLQHSLDPRSTHDLEIQGICDQWFMQSCKTAVPSDEDQWMSCLVVFLKQSIAFLQGIKACIRAIERDESREQILLDWEFRRNRFHAPHEFDSVIEVAAADIGREGIDIEQFRRRHYEKWVKELEQLNGEYDFHLEARKCVERDLLFENVLVIPITGHDIMRDFGVPPGPKVGELLNLAKSIYMESPCSKSSLLEKLRISLEARHIQESSD